MAKQAVRLALSMIGCAILQMDAASLRKASQQSNVDTTLRKFGYIQRSLVQDEGKDLGNFIGADLPGDAKMTAELCYDMCEGRSACKSFTFSPEDDGWCGLRDKCVDEDTPAQRFPQDVFSTFFIQQASTSWYTRSLVADQGGHLETKMQQTIQSCAASCDAHPDCHSYTFQESSGQCHLKDKCVDAHEASADEGYAREYKTGYKMCKKWVQRDNVLEEGNMLEMWRTPASDCLFKCQGNPRCKSVSFKELGNICKLNDKEVSEASPGSPSKQRSSFSTYYKLGPC